MAERPDQRRVATPPSPPADAARAVAEFRREYERQFPGLLDAMG
ncbi:MAG: hypothetical protein AABY18_01980 [Candidatus Thermoplasmatota archaeon]